MPICVRFGSSEQPKSALVEERPELFEPLLDRHRISHALPIDRIPSELERLLSNNP